MKSSIVILTYNRPDMLRENLKGIREDIGPELEVIVVDNSTDEISQTMVRQEFPETTHIKNPVNMGVAGRNLGIQMATGDVVVTLDDDVTGLNDSDITLINERFAEDPDLGALCFKVLDPKTNLICNWCHHRKSEVDGDSRFRTYEISEGAVAYRVSALSSAGLYFEKFFISHEGKDLAYRIMNSGYVVEYDGRITVDHHFGQAGRPDWRRYYFDTRNSIWLAIRNMPFWYGLRFLSLAMGSLGVYSIRDGFLGPYLRGVRDGFKAWNEIRADRTPWNENTRALCREIDKRKPGFLYMVRKRLFRKGVQI